MNLWLVCLPLLMIGCASTMNHDYMDMVQVPVSTSPPGATLIIDGREYTSPDFVWVPRGMGDITMSIEKDGYQPVDVIFRQSQDGWAWGNLIAGGPVGLGADYLTGGIYSVLPDQVHLKLEEMALAMPVEHKPFALNEPVETGEVSPLLVEDSDSSGQENEKISAGAQPETGPAQEPAVPEEQVEVETVNDVEKEQAQDAGGLLAQEPGEFQVKDIYFNYDSWDITQESQYLLEKTADWLKKQPSTQVMIEGHSDDRGTNQYNLVLGRKRAMAIQAYLVDLGVDRSRLKVIGLGEERPSCRLHTEACYQRNRRAHFVFQNL